MREQSHHTSTSAHRGWETHSEVSQNPQRVGGSREVNAFNGQSDSAAPQPYGTAGITGTTESNDHAKDSAVTDMDGQGEAENQTKSVGFALACSVALCIAVVLAVIISSVHPAQASTASANDAASTSTAVVADASQIAAAGATADDSDGTSDAAVGADTPASGLAGTQTSDSNVSGGTAAADSGVSVNSNPTADSATNVQTNEAVVSAAPSGSAKDGATAGSSTSGDAAGNAMGTPAHVDHQSGQAKSAGWPWPTQELEAEGWVTNARHTDMDVTVSNRTPGIMNTDGVRPSQFARSVAGFTFWKASIKGGNYGDEQGETPSPNRVNSGVFIDRIRYRNNQLQFMASDTSQDSRYSNGNWHAVDEGAWSPQLVFYYLQDEPIGDLATIHMSDWFVSSFSTRPYFTSKAVIGQVVDADTGRSLAQSPVMYFHDDHHGVSAVTVSEQDLAQYEITKIVKCAAQETDLYSPWNYQGKCGAKLAEYKVADMAAGMATTWRVDDHGWWAKGGSYDPNRVVFQIQVRSTGRVQVSEAQVSNDRNGTYRGANFALTAHLILPEGAQLRGSYPIEGTTEGMENLDFRPAGSGREGDSFRFSVRAGTSAVIKGLPVGSSVRFTQVGGPTADLSDFATSYEPASATAIVTSPKPRDMQTVSISNTLSVGEGQLKVSETLSGLDQLTDSERLNLREDLRITFDDGKVAPLSLSAGEPQDGDSIDEPGADNKVTYTWNLNKLEEKAMLLTKSGHDAVKAPVKATVQIDDGEILPAASTSVQVCKELHHVKFASTYSPKVTYEPAVLDSLSVRKSVEGTATDNDFDFRLAPADGTDTTAIEGLDSDGSLTTTISDGFGKGRPVTRDASFSPLKFTKEGDYSFDIAEVTPASGAPVGWKYDGDTVHVTVHVAASTKPGEARTERAGAAGIIQLDASVAYAYADGDEDSTQANAKTAAFTNHFSSVASLPLSGSRAERMAQIAGLAVIFIGLIGVLAVVMQQRRKSIKNL